MVHRVVASAFDPLRIEGSRLRGGRYNPPGEFGALYCSLEPATAAAEIARGRMARGIDPSAVPEGSLSLYDVEVSLDAVLDLTNPEILHQLGLSVEALKGGDLTIPRRLAQEARDTGYQAILAPSAAVPGAKNLVLFLDRLSAPPRVLSSRSTLLS